jgi:hypothetical protein
MDENPNLAKLDQVITDLQTRLTRRRAETEQDLARLRANLAEAERLNRDGYSAYLRTSLAELEPFYQRELADLTEMLGQDEALRDKLSGKKQDIQEMPSLAPTRATLLALLATREQQMVELGELIAKLKARLKRDRETDSLLLAETEEELVKCHARLAEVTRSVEQLREEAARMPE